MNRYSLMVVVLVCIGALALQFQGEYTAAVLWLILLELNHRNWPVDYTRRIKTGKPGETITPIPDHLDVRR